jgi:hypothetical protein
VDRIGDSISRLYRPQGTPNRSLAPKSHAGKQSGQLRRTQNNSAHSPLPFMRPNLQKSTHGSQCAAGLACALCSVGLVASDCNARFTSTSFVHAFRLFLLVRLALRYLAMNGDSGLAFGSTINRIGEVVSELNVDRAGRA